MVASFNIENTQKKRFKNQIKADVIILGCSIPGIVTAHNLKKKFGNSMDIVVLDFATSITREKDRSGYRVAFLGDDETDIEEDDDDVSFCAKKTFDDVGRYYLEKYCSDFNIPYLDDIILRNKEKLPQAGTRQIRRKLFEFRNGNIVPCLQSYHDFNYLNFLERFELQQFQTLLNSNMQKLFQPSAMNCDSDRKRLLYFDHTSMESYISGSLFFSNSKQIMRTIVRLICGAPAHEISVLFYLHQCHRVNNSRNHIDGDNIRFREKIIGFFRKRLIHRLHKSVANITVTSKPIKEIRTSANQQVILEPEKGETNYICKLLAMALKPEQLQNIEMESKLLGDNDAKTVEMASELVKGHTLKFVIEYEENFWQPLGFSGDILSVRGPILWAMERPALCQAKSANSAALVGCLEVTDVNKSSEREVIDQLVKLFGEEAANPISYRQVELHEIYIPRMGDYVDLRKLTTERRPRLLEWGALDIFDEGDILASIEAGHTAYVHLVGVLRPQALTYEDVVGGGRPLNLYNHLGALAASVNIWSISQALMLGVAVVVGIQVLRNTWSKR